jgi:hypothetical protein
MKLYNYSVKVNYNGNTKRYANNNSIPWNWVQDELKELYKDIEEHNGIVETVSIKEVRI